MSFISECYKALPAAALLLLLGPTGRPAAETALLAPPTAFSGYYVPTPPGVPAGNGTGVLVFLVWNGVPAESSDGFSGFRVRRTITGVSQRPLEVVGQWLMRFGGQPVPTSPLCLQTSAPCDLPNFAFTGTGVFFKGFQQNALPGGGYILDYPPGAPQDRCDSCWVYADLSALAGFRHEYGVTSIGSFNLTDYDETNLGPGHVVYMTPATPPPDDLERVAVVPNPFKGRAEWDPGPGENRIHFIHIPAGATVRIFTASAELVRELTMDPNRSPGGLSGELSWDLQNAHGRNVSSGIYIYQVETTEGRIRKGHFVIIR